MENNTWYYTLSTISQTLAAIMGLGAVFLVLQLENTAKQINDYRGRAVDILMIIARHISEYKFDIKASISTIQSDMNIIAKDYLAKYASNSSVSLDVLRFARMYEPAKQLSTPEFVDETNHNLSRFISDRNRLRGLIVGPGIFTSLTIGFVLGLLGLSDVLRKYDWLLAIAVLLALLSIFLVISNSWKILKGV